MNPSWFLLFYFISEYRAVPLLTSFTRKISLFEDSDPTNVTHVASSVHLVIAVDYHLARGEVYYSEATGQIYRSSLRPDGGVENRTIIVEVKLSDGIAVDWVHDHIYWTDANSKTLEVANLDGLYRKVLRNATHGLDKPRAVVVDPFKGLLFWSDWGANARVESSGLDGRENKTLISSNVQWPNGLALDLSRNKLYILDGFLSTISSCNYDGSDSKVLVRSPDNLLQGFGLSYYASNLYFSSWHKRALFKLNIYNQRSDVILQKSGIEGLAERMMGMKAVHSSLQPRQQGPDPCKTSGCSHRCLLSRTFTPTCYCPFGFKLSSDNKTCIEEGYLLVSWRRTIRRYSFDVSENEALIDTASAVISLGYHLQKGLVFWSDIEEHRIYRAPLDQLNNKTVIATPETCDGLAVDWVHDVLYWTDVNRKTLEAAQLDGSKHTIIFDKDLDQPRDIALDPFEGFIFWTDWGTIPKVEKSTLDGLKRQIIVDDNHIWPNGMTIDIPLKKIYYVDGKIGSIYSCSYDGSNKKTIFEPPPIATVHPFAIAHFKNELYWTDWQARAIVTSSIEETSPYRYGILATSSSVFLRPNGLKVVHSSLQEPKDNPCAKVSCRNLCVGTEHQAAHCIGEETPSVVDISDHPVLVMSVTNDSLDISLNKTQDLVLITVDCIRRMGCEDDAHCSHQSEELHTFEKKANFHIPNLLPGSQYEIMFISHNYTEFLNITTKLTDPPEVVKITSVEQNGRNITVKWEPVDTCVPGFNSYHYKLYKTGEESTTLQEGNTTLTQVTFENLKPEASYKVDVYTYNPQYFSSKTFDVHKEECYKPNSQCDGKEDCPDGSDEDVKQCAAIDNVIVYKKSKSQVYFRVEVRNYTRKQLDKFIGSYHSEKLGINKDFERSAEPCIMWPESYCFEISSLQPYTVFNFKISAVQKGAKVGAKFSVSATTKEEVSGPPENVKVFKHNATCLIYQWNHPNQSNGIIRSFMINIDEAETHDSQKCCQSFPIIERPVTEEEPFYEAAATGLTPASSYAISFAAKNMYIGASTTVMVDTPPPPMDIKRLPRVEVASVLPLSWQPMTEHQDELPQYPELIRSYILILHPNKNEPISEGSIIDNDAIKELLQSNFGEKYVVLWMKNVEDEAAFQTPIKVGNLTARKQYKLSWIQVSQYKTSYSIDFLESDPFVAL